MFMANVFTHKNAGTNSLSIAQVNTVKIVFTHKNAATNSL